MKILFVFEDIENKYGNERAGPPLFGVLSVAVRAGEDFVYFRGHVL